MPSPFEETLVSFDTRIEYGCSTQSTREIQNEKLALLSF